MTMTHPDDISVFNSVNVKPLFPKIIDHLNTQTPFERLFLEMFPNGVDTTLLGKVSVKKMGSYMASTIDSDKLMVLSRKMTSNGVELLIRLHRHYQDTQKTVANRYTRIYEPIPNYTLHVSYTFAEFKRLGIKLPNNAETVRLVSPTMTFDHKVDPFEVFLLRLADTFNNPAHDPMKKYEKHIEYFNKMRAALTKVPT